MQRKLNIIIFTTITTMLLATGCSGRTETEIPTEEDKTVVTTNGDVNYETVTWDYVFDTQSSTFEDDLFDDSFYVVHNGKYYALYEYLTNYGASASNGDTADPNKQFYTLASDENNIPTLFLDNGDELVYYSTSQLLDYKIFQRMYDWGYTIGLFNIKTMQNGRCYVDLTDESSILQGTDLTDLYELGVENALLDKISNKVLTEDYVEVGLVSHATKMASYDLDVYAGTYYNHFLATADVRAFLQYELYALGDYETMKQYYYKINIPDFLETGYYFIEGQGMFRLVRGKSYNDETDFNKQVLFASVPDDTNNNDSIKKYDEYKLLLEEYPYMTCQPCYSPIISLNHFTTNIPDALGYEDKTVGETIEDNKVGQTILKEATIKEVKLWFPLGKECTVKITSRDAELGGDISIKYLDNSSRKLNYSKLDGFYYATFIGDGTQGTLKISSLYKPYDINLINCEVYNDQDKISDTPIVPISTETATEQSTTAEQVQPTPSENNN